MGIEIVTLHHVSLSVTDLERARAFYGGVHAVLLGLLAPTRMESGCLRYQMFVNTEDPTEFTFTEEWTDAAALDAHFETAHIRGALERFPELLAEELDLRRYTLVG